MILNISDVNGQLFTILQTTCFTFTGPMTATVSIGESTTDSSLIIAHRTTVYPPPQFWWMSSALTTCGDSSALSLKRHADPVLVDIMIAGLHSFLFNATIPNRFAHLSNAILQTHKSTERHRLEKLSEREMEPTMAKASTAALCRASCTTKPAQQKAQHERSKNLGYQNNQHHVGSVVRYVECEEQNEAWSRPRI